MNAVTDMLGCRHPIILGAMGVICNPELVAAVSDAVDTVCWPQLLSRMLMYCGGRSRKQKS